MRRRTALAITASLAVVLSAPFIGQLRGFIQEAFPDHYRLIILSLVGLALLVAAHWAVRSISDHRLQRYGLIALAVIVAAGYALATATGNANVDAIERFHFVEYGLLSVLYHRAWGDRGSAPAPASVTGSNADERLECDSGQDGPPRRRRGRQTLRRARRAFDGLSRASLVLPFMATSIVGTMDEAMQWFVPLRVGEWRDVALNSVAIACGLLFAVAVSTWGPASEVAVRRPGPRSGPGGVAGRSSRDPALLATGLAVAAFAAFVYVVHAGHEIRDPAIGVFRSRFTADELLAASADRAARWRTNPPIDVRRLSREDQYLAEAIWHVQRRNEADRDGGIWAQWKENLILEKYFAPVLDTPTYLTPAGARWSDEQRANAAAAAAAETRLFVSDAPPVPIYVLRRHDD